MIKINKPTLVLDKAKCLENLQRMHDKARISETRFRPHFKTHQSAIIGNWFRKLGIHSITVSTVTMAKYFSNYGWKDITISLPVNILEAYDINELAIGVKLNLVAESLEPIQKLDTYLVYEVGIFIEIDTGYQRSGIVWKDLKEIEKILEYLNKATKVKFKGFFTHSGHTYQAENKEEIREIYKDTVLKMNYLKERYIGEYPDLIISVGDTPSCSLVDDFKEVDEIRPGNFLFYDLMQYSIGACTLDQIALTLAAPVVAKSPQRNEIVSYGGATHLSKDFLFKSNGDRIYGYVVKYEENQWSKPIKGTYLANVTQDHGIIRSSKEFVDSVNRGDVLGILPVHSCLAANLLRKYITLEGDAVDY